MFWDALRYLREFGNNQILSCLGDIGRPANIKNDVDYWTKYLENKIHDRLSATPQIKVPNFSIVHPAFMYLRDIITQKEK